jgi:hypothetical protein
MIRHNHTLTIRCDTVGCKEEITMDVSYRDIKNTPTAEVARSGLTSQSWSVLNVVQNNGTKRAVVHCPEHVREWNRLIGVRVNENAWPANMADVIRGAFG